jgi:CRP/FNR family cyclic AMP-dependent transcriptional regulator
LPVVGSPSLYQRRRAPTQRELDLIPWLRPLAAEDREAAAARILVGDAAAGDMLCREGRAATFYFGVIDGLVKMTSYSADGDPITYAGLSSGGWFGEGTVLKREPYRYNIEVLRASVVAGLPVDTFHWLLARSIAFNRYVMSQLNERLGQFIAARETDRLVDSDMRVARGLASLLNPVLYPGAGDTLRITQQELSYLVGLSRQRVNEALVRLAAAGLVEVRYGSIRVLDLQALVVPVPQSHATCAPNK